MLGVLANYLMVAGGVAAGAQVARGVTRGVSRLLHGDPRGALVEVAGGLAAPALTAAGQLFCLGQEVAESAIELAIGKEHGSEDSAWVLPILLHRHREPAATGNGAV
jgi:hypothetical protein